MLAAVTRKVGAKYTRHEFECPRCGNVTYIDAARQTILPQAHTTTETRIRARERRRQSALRYGMPRHDCQICPSFCRCKESCLSGREVDKSARGSCRMHCCSCLWAYGSVELRHNSGLMAHRTAWLSACEQSTSARELPWQCRQERERERGFYMLQQDEYEQHSATKQLSADCARIRAQAAATLTMRRS